MTRGKEHYKQNIYENAYARFFTATNTAMLEYPFIVGRYDECSPTHAKNAEEYILDSAIGDPSIGNQDVLDKATDIGADTVVAADVKNDPEATTERILDMVERAEGTDFELMIPLQFDDTIRHEDHYDSVVTLLQKAGYDPDAYRYLAGGINDKTALEQIERIIELREHVGTGVYLHGLGMGLTREWVVTIRQCPWLLDSFDSSSVVKNFTYSSKIPTIDMEWLSFPRPRGTNSTAISVQYREAILDMFNYMIGTDINEEDALNEFETGDVELIERVQKHKQWYRSQDETDVTVEV